MEPFTQPEVDQKGWYWVPQPLPCIGDLLERPDPDRPVYGLYCWASEYLAHHDFIREVGWTNFRLSGPITYAYMRQVVKDNVEVMFTMPARDPFPTEEHPLGEWRNRGSFDTDEAFLERYLADVEKVIRRYGPEGAFFKENPDLPHHPLRYIEVFNEPNFWYLDIAREDKANHVPPKDPEARRLQNESRRKLYAKLLSETYARIKALNPEIRVVGFGAGGSASADVGFIADVHELDKRVRNAYDILSTHPYSKPAPPEGMNANSWGDYSKANTTRQIRAIQMRYRTQDKPIWWTELNYSIPGEAGGRYDTPSPRNMSPMIQAAAHVRGYLWAMRLGVDRLHYMSVQDTDGVNAGFLNDDGSWRPAAHAVKTLISLLPHPRITGVVKENRVGIYAYRLDPDVDDDANAEVVVAWKVDGRGTVDVPWPQAEAVLVDMLGNRKTLQAVDRRIILPIGPAPVYLIP